MIYGYSDATICPLTEKCVKTDWNKILKKLKKINGIFGYYNPNNEKETKIANKIIKEVLGDKMKYTILLSFIWKMYLTTKPYLEGKKIKNLTRYENKYFDIKDEKCYHYLNTLMEDVAKKIYKPM